MVEARDAPQTNDPPNPNAGKLTEEDVKKSHWTVESVLSTLPERPQPNAESPLPFFHVLERLKTTKRAGWRRFGIDHGESISDHMYRMSIITMLAPPALAARLDIPRCTKMALVHDMAELLVGDITPVDKVPKEEKSRRETATMDYLCGGLLGGWSGGLQAEDIRAIWQEYEDDRTEEAKFVHDVDKMELLLQMVEYERTHECAVDLGEFCWVATKVKMPEVREWSVTVLQERVKLWKSLGKKPLFPQCYRQRIVVIISVPLAS
ncbi:HD domain-containing protein [Lineolata rhizophorae]|uniref:5'-deoxynucleotidase n=1 Tax=Lineolata rhizophorae TaxID=578093 RepID=A0A6A6NTJ9_9PEZI|nr:HD domain-containing protein [Lineolata rhizophorae]